MGKETKTDPDTSTETEDPEQAKLDQQFAARARQATATARADVARELGMSIEDAAKVLAAAKAADEAAKTEAQRQADRTSAAEAAAKAAEAKAAEAERMQGATLALAAAGVDPAAIPRVARLLDLGSEVSAADQIEQLRKDLPGLFGKSSGTPSPPTTTTTTSKAGTATGKEDPEATAKRQLDRVFAKRRGRQKGN